MPRRDVDRLSQQLEDLITDLWEVPRFAGLRRGFRPAVDAYRTDDPPALTVVVELAGVDPDTVSVTAVPDGLLIRGQRLRPRAPGRTYQLMEIEVGPFERRIPLPEDVDTEAASASYEAGLLTIVLPLAPRRRGSVRVSVQGRRP
jgi:HSP20 family protein